MCRQRVKRIDGRRKSKENETTYERDKKGSYLPCEQVWYTKGSGMGDKYIKRYEFKRETVRNKQNKYRRETYLADEAACSSQNHIATAIWKRPGRPGMLDEELTTKVMRFQGK